jgi:hypothetical protein
LIGAMTLAVALATTNASVQVFDPSKYPDIMGQWKRPPGVANQWDTRIWPIRLGRRVSTFPGPGARLRSPNWSTLIP